MPIPPTIKVTIAPSSAIAVRGSASNQQTVDAITYGTRSLKSAYDLESRGALDGDIIQYIAATDTYKVSPFSGNNISITNIDGGSY
jgi:hypothetical protein